MDDKAINGPEVRTRCLLKFQFSHPQVGWAQTKKRGTGGRVVDFTEDGRNRDQMGKGIGIWTRKVYDYYGVCLITQICF